MSQPIQPLRIQKNTPSSSPNKMPANRPLTELGPMERRRNSPSYNQPSMKPMFQGESSPFDSSPFAPNSPRLYWQSRDPASPTRSIAENRSPHDDRDHSPSPAKRSSIENLKRASRVKNSNMFAREHKQEYDPTSSPQIERPLATGRPLSTQVPGNAYGGRGLEGFRKEVALGSAKISSLKSPGKFNAMPEVSASPAKGQSSPAKSSMSNKNRYVQAQVFNPENSIWSDDEESYADHQLPPGKSLHRHAKSVTFDAAPPQVNEYEMTTPDPSSLASGSRDGSHDSTEDEEDESFDRISSIERDDSFDASLEDTEKTPVVLPEDWRFMSPAVANEDLAAHVENPFDEDRSSPAPTARPSSALDARLSPTRTDSTNSNGERRPLPPLPALGMPAFPRARSDSNSSLSATVERASSTQRASPSPRRPPSITKSEIQGMGGCSMPIEDRLRLMMIQEDSDSKVPAEEQREGRLHRGSTARIAEPENAQNGVEIREKEIENDDIADLGEYKLPPRISRESILRKVKGRKLSVGVEEDEYSLNATFERHSVAELDPDTPLPSTEIEVVEREVVIKQEPDEDSEVDVYSIPDLYQNHMQAESYMNAIEKLEAFQKSEEHAAQRYDDEESNYSVDSKTEDLNQHRMNNTNEGEGPPTPRVMGSTLPERQLERKQSHRMSLPQFAALLGEQDFGFGMESFLSESPPVTQEPVKPAVPPKSSLSTSPPIDQQKAGPITSAPELEQSIYRPVTPEEQLYPPRFPGHGNDAEIEQPRTPDSVIRHPVTQASAPESPGIPEPVATIKASGSRLKTRVSATPTDICAMADTRRKVSNEVPAGPNIAERHMSRPSIVAESDEAFPDSVGESTSVGNPEHNEILKQPKRKSSLIPLDIPVDGGDGLGDGIESEFDRLIEAQKVAFNFPSPEMGPQPRSPGYAEYMAGQGIKSIVERSANVPIRTQKGYLMRQNTKVIIASSASYESNESDSTAPQDPTTRGSRSAGNSPRKPSQQTWITEPWNGKMRRKSIRQSGGRPAKRPLDDPAPPLPGQESNVTSGLDSVVENEAAPSTEEVGDGGERGRLFVKVVRVKDLDMPLPKGERSYFALTLDNGMHCVTTAWLELGKTAPIGQEFELIVLDDLEFQLTLQTKVEEPKAKPLIESPTKSTSPTKPSTFSRMFTSPKKRKELEIKQQEEAQKADGQRQQEAQARRRATQPTAWDLLHDLIAKDGSFARSYVCLKDHESCAYGKPYTVDVPCFNEWAMEDVRNVSSVKSKRSTNNGGVQRKAPYRVGKLELQLLYIPKPKGATDVDMPKSMNACIRELKEAESATPKKWEGHLSQQGGDCPYWRRRFFTLDGSKFTAYHEATRQPRATINLAKASKLIDDKSALMRQEGTNKKGGRRKSAFAEEEEGYMFVEEGFRVRFANGETIDFYADSAAEKDGWMKILADVVGKDVKKEKTWTEMVLAKHRAEAAKAAQAQQSPSKMFHAKSGPPTPAKSFAPAPPISEKSPRRSDIAQRRADVSKTRSMVF